MTDRRTDRQNSHHNTASAVKIAPVTRCQMSTDRIIIVVNVRIICMQLQQLDFDDPVFLTLCHKPSILISIRKRPNTSAVAAAILRRISSVQQPQLMHRCSTGRVTSKQRRMKTLLMLHHMLLVQLLLLMLRKRRTMHAKQTHIIIAVTIHFIVTS